ncbi:MAG: CpaF family protein [Vampirovibrionales bacterium]|nr:CpaF family protein [Vampirovibrionales bacterium]
MSFNKSGKWGFNKAGSQPAHPAQADEQSIVSAPATGASSSQAPQSTPSVQLVAKPAEVPKYKSPLEARTNQARANQARAKTDAKPTKEEVDPYHVLKSSVHRRLIEEIDFNQMKEQNPERLRVQIKDAVKQLLLEEETLLTASERDRLVEEIVHETMGLGPLEQLLSDISISEIMINGPHTVFVERQGKVVESGVRFKDDAHLMQIIDRIVSAVGRRVDETQPLCDARLKDGSRFNCIIPPLALDGPTVTIRKFSKDPLTVEDLINFGSLTPEAAELLRGFVEARLNIVISGGTGSGKTTLLNVLSSFIPNDDRIITVEDTAELQLQQRHVVRLETRPANLEGRGEIAMRDLVKNALRMRPERIVVGECRSGETLDMLQAMNTGHDGSLTTLHANNPRDAIRRMETMVMMAGYDLPQRAIREQIASAVNIIIQASRLSDGSRRVMNITEIVGMEGDVILLQDIFSFYQQGLDEDRKVVGEFKATGIRPRFLQTLEEHGVKIDESIFEPV